MILKKKVLHIIWNAKFGGIEKLVYELAEEQLYSKKVEPTVVIAKQEGEFVEKFQKSDFPTIFLDFAKGLDFNPTNFKKARKLFKEFDVLHFHFFNPILALVAYGTKKSIVYTEHGNFGFGRKEKKFERFLNLLKKKFLEHSRVSITYNSNFTRKYAETHLGLEQHSKSYVITNGINLNDYFDKKNKEPQQKEFDQLKKQLQGKFVVGTSSRFAGFKRIDRLIKAFHMLPKDSKTVLLLVGDGILMPELRKQAEALNLQNQVIFTGFVDKVRHYQALMDVCVFASELEPFGLVAVETLSLGKPTIVFKNGGGLVEIVNGVNKDDVVSDINHLVRRIEYYRDNKALLEELKEKRITYSKSFSISSVAESLEPIYYNER